MQKRRVTQAKATAVVGTYAVVDVLLGIGLVNGFIGLFLTEAQAASRTPQGLMARGEAAVPWAALALVATAVARFGTQQNKDEAARQPWSPRRQPMLAALVAMLEAQGADPDDAELAALWSEWLDPPAGPEDFRIARARFARAGDTATSRAVAAIHDPRDRAALICMAIVLLQRLGDPSGRGMAMLEDWSDRFGFTGADIGAFWDDAHNLTPMEDFIDGLRSMTGFGLDHAKARVGPVASRAKTHTERGFMAFLDTAAAMILWGLNRLIERFQRVENAVADVLMALPAAIGRALQPFAARLRQRLPF